MIIIAGDIKTTDIQYLKGVGPKKALLYKKLGINTVYDLIRYFPRDYIDLTKPVTISDAQIGETAVISGYVKRKLPPAMIRKGMSIYRLIFSDDNDEITVTIFNSKYAFDNYSEGNEYILQGRIGGTPFFKEMTSPLCIPANSDNTVLPVYPLTKGVTQNMLKKDMKTALSLFDEPDPLNEEMRLKYNLTDLKRAIFDIHFPKNLFDAQKARDRFIFEELLTLSLGLSLLRKRNRKLTAVKMKNLPIDEFYSSLPFDLTGAQKRAIIESISDMCGDYPSNRLIQGDVGSGKTAVAAACCYFTVKNGYQAVLMAPTEILSSQHHKTLCEFLNPLGIRVGLLNGALTPASKRRMREDIKNGYYNVIVGTHALVQKDTEFQKLGLVITDEQHRFGVKHRSMLLEKGENPHSLVMSATPIPRTLALIIYGDLDISILDEMPKGRQKIKTFVISGKKREDAYGFVKHEIANGRQAYIVCPMIEDNEETSLASVINYAESLENDAFKGISIAVLHGKLPASQKEQIMNDFINGEIKVLVSTTVVEVGIDVPNATIMFIENAERFGLSQLHQLRGRVGRGKWQSYCILLSNNFGDVNKQRMKIMAQTSDGFEIAKQDLALRGPGDFFGQRQHGLPPLKTADMAQDTEILLKAQQEAEKILKSDKSLQSSENKGLLELVTQLFANAEEYGFN